MTFFHLMTTMDVRQDSSVRARKVTRAFKLAKNLDDAVILQSDKRGITPSSFMNNLLVQYFDWWQFAEKGSPFMALDRRLLMTIIDEVSEEKSTDIARSMALMTSREFIKSRFGKLDLDSVLGFLELLGARMNWGEITTRKSNVGALEVTVKHDMGAKWSVFLSEFISSLFSAFLDMETVSEFSTFGCSVTATPKGSHDRGSAKKP